MTKELEVMRKKRCFLSKSMTNTLKSVNEAKSVDEALSLPDNHARIQALRASCCKYRESGDKVEISNLFTFYQNSLFGDLFSKIA